MINTCQSDGSGAALNERVWERWTKWRRKNVWWTQLIANYSSHIEWLAPWLAAHKTDMIGIDWISEMIKEARWKSVHCTLLQRCLSIIDNTKVCKNLDATKQKNLHLLFGTYNYWRVWRSLFSQYYRTYMHSPTWVVSKGVVRTMTNSNIRIIKLFVV
jgi:hypothetical protein